MKIIYLWGSSTVPKPKEWVEFCPLRAAYVEDDNIPAFNVRASHPYYNVGIRKKMYFVLTESSFFTLSYIDKVIGTKYVLKSMVSIKEEASRDYDVVIVTSETEYNNLLSKYSNKVEFDDVIVKELVTSDPSVELFYYPKEVVDVIETF
jgi:hypothetical protein